MRCLALVALLAACTSIEAESLGDGDNDGLDPGAPGCAIDSDCVPTSSSCCGCPTFAVPAGSVECGSIDCPGTLDCAPTEAFCDAGACRLRCVETEVTRVCDAGFEVDAAGCAVDQCAAVAPECEVDCDCALAPADCCGCELGGADTAVPAAELDDHLASLECADESFCPGIDACDETATPSCLGGTCRLVSGPGLDEAISGCGSADAPSCPEGAVCVVNHPLAPPGVAICRQL
jgi:hypothetical protein